MNNQIPKRNKISILRKWNNVVGMCDLNLPFSALIHVDLFFYKTIIYPNICAIVDSSII